MTKPVDHNARHRFVELVEAELTKAGCDTSPALARYLLVRLDAAHLRIHDATPPAASDWRTPGHSAPPPADYLAARAALRQETPHD